MSKRQFAVTVKESGEGKPWLLVEPHEENGLPDGSHIVMYLPDGATVESAQQIANTLNGGLTSIKIARF